MNESKDNLAFKNRNIGELYFICSSAIFLKNCIFKLLACVGDHIFDVAFCVPRNLFFLILYYILLETSAKRKQLK